MGTGAGIQLTYQPMEPSENKSLGCCLLKLSILLFLQPSKKKQGLLSSSRKIFIMLFSYQHHNQ
jgi:hypothetical protein